MEVAHLYKSDSHYISFRTERWFQSPPSPLHPAPGLSFPKDGSRGDVDRTSQRTILRGLTSINLMLQVLLYTAPITQLPAEYIWLWVRSSEDLWIPFAWPPVISKNPLTAKFELIRLQSHDKRPTSEVGECNISLTNWTTATIIGWCLEPHSGIWQRSTL